MFLRVFCRDNFKPGVDMYKLWIVNCGQLEHFKIVLWICI